MAAGPPPVVLVVGDEPLLVERAVARTVAAARALEPAVEQRTAEVTGLTPAAFSDLVAPSLFAEPRVVVLTGTQDAAKEIATALLQYAADPVPDVVLVVVHSGGGRTKALADGLRKAGAALLTCEKITRVGDRQDFVKAEIRAAGGVTDSAAIAALVEAVGSDLRELASAAGQLVADSGGTVDVAAVRRYHHGKAEVNGFAVADLTVAGDVPGALEALRWAVGIGVAQVLIADALADGIRTVARVRSARGGNSYAVASELGMPPWKVDKARSAARHWSEAGLAAAMGVAGEVNGAVKGLAADPDYALEKAVIEIARARQLR